MIFATLKHLSLVFFKVNSFFNFPQSKSNYKNQYMHIKIKKFVCHLKSFHVLLSLSDLKLLNTLLVHRENSFIKFYPNYADNLKA